MAETYRMRKHRLSIGLPLQEAALRVGTHWVNLHRIEDGQQSPKMALARKLFELYEGRVPLAAIYDPEYHAQLPRRKRKASAT